MNDNEADALRALRTVMPASDAAYPILQGILGVVPASRWAFARVEQDGTFAALFCSNADGTQLTGLADELKRQRAKTPTGPRIAAMMGPLENFDSGIVLVFADPRTNYGILTLLRTAELGPFTSSEISMLALALDAMSDRLSFFRLHPNEQRSGSRREADVVAHTEGAFYVLDTDLQIVLAWSADDQRRAALTGLHTQIAARLPAVLETTVRDLTHGWSTDSVHNAGVARPVPFLVVRTEPLSGPAGLFIGVHVDRFRPPNSLSGASIRFHISPRELQVLTLIIDGNSLDEVAKQLSITSSTVQDHIKNMLTKTASSNRSELIGRILGWESTPKASQA
jgi:DNA-binding CsgD family transcriptional regulator